RSGTASSTASRPPSPPSNPTTRERRPAVAYYQIDWDAIHRLPARQQLEVLADIAATVPALVAQERVRVVGRTVERHAAERPWGAQSRAAAELGLTRGRVGQLWAEYKAHNMTTTSYGTFVGNVADPGPAGNMRDYVTTALGDYAGSFDVDAIVADPGPACNMRDYVPPPLGASAGSFDADAIAADYRDAINERLADEGITRAGDEFYGPHRRPENSRDTIAAAIGEVDFWAIAEK